MKEGRKERIIIVVVVVTKVHLQEIVEEKLLLQLEGDLLSLVL
jgi:hypothetical protein